MFPTLPIFQAITSQPFKRAQLGLFQGKTKQYGNNVPFSKKKTRRTWLPNVQSKRLVSGILERTLKLKVTTRALKTIKKYGGLDKYILESKPEILAYQGMRIRTQLHDRLRKQETPSPADARSALETELKKQERSTATRLRGLHGILIKPTLEDARRQRALAAQAAGKDDEKLNAYHTIKFLSKTRPETAGLRYTKYTSPV